jgi:potassium efflux system protein
MSVRIRCIAVRLWLALMLLLAGPALAFAQTPAAPSQQQTQEQEQPAQPPEEPAQTPAAEATQPPAAQAEAPVAPLPLGVAEAAGKARRLAEQSGKQLEQLEAQLSNPSVPREEVLRVREEVENLREGVRNADMELQAPLGQINDQISRLGPVPKEGESEPESVAAQRAQLNKARDELAGGKAQLALVAGSAEQLSARAAQIERARFLNNLLGTSKSILNPSLWTQGATHLGDLWARLSVLLRGFADRLSQDRGAWAVSLLFVALGIFIAATVAVCRIIARRARQGSPGEAEFDKWLRTVSVPIGYTVAAAVAVFLFDMLFMSLSPNSPRVQRLVEAIGLALVAFAFGRGVARSLLSPTRPEWRTVPMSSGGAAEWLVLATLAFGLVSLHNFTKALADVVNMDASFDVSAGALVSLLLVLITGRLILVARRESLSEEKLEPGLKPGFHWANYMVQPVWLLLAAALIALLLGYVTLGVYLTTSLFVVAPVVTLLYCIRQLSDAFVAQSLKPKSRISRALKSAFSMSDKAINRSAIALNAGVDISLLLLGLPLVLGLTSLTWVDVRSWLTTTFFGFKVGDITISLSSILLAVVVFVIGLGLTRFVTGWLDRRILTPTEMDPGVRNSLRTAAGYLAVIVVLLMAFAAAGVDFSNIAIVAGALSVGIGFGLQSIVNNFVSGLILLAERPIRVGDWVQVSGGEGTVRKINVRSTEIETFDRCAIIVPNSSLISESVQNWTHGDLLGRVRVAIGVSYDADPKQVEEILLKCAREHARALQFPEPTVLFKDFGASSLDFEVRVFIDDVNWVAFVGSDLRFSIHKALKEAGIEIPFPQRDVHVTGFKEAVKGAVAEAVGEAGVPARTKQVLQRKRLQARDSDGDS